MLLQRRLVSVNLYQEKEARIIALLIKVEAHAALFT